MPAKFQHILVVDNNPDVLATVPGLLDELGYRVSTARSSSEARAVIKAGAVDLLISDEFLAGDLGRPLGVYARSIGVPVLLLSGHPASMELLVGGHFNFTSTPFQATDLDQTVSEILATPKGAANGR